MRAAGLACVALAAALGAPARAAAAPVRPTWAPSVPDLVVGVVVAGDAAGARDLERGATLAVEALAFAGHRPVRVALRAVTSAWGSAGSVTVDLVRRDGAGVVVAPPDRATAHEVVQVASKLGVPVVSLARAPSVAGTGSPWCVPAFAPAPGDADDRPPPPPSAAFVAAFAGRFHRAPGLGAAAAFRGVVLAATACERAPAAGARARRDALHAAAASARATAAAPVAYDPWASDPFRAPMATLAPW